MVLALLKKISAKNADSAQSFFLIKLVSKHIKAAPAIILNYALFAVTVIALKKPISVERHIATSVIDFIMTKRDVTFSQLNSKTRILRGVSLFLI